MKISDTPQAVPIGPTTPVRAAAVGAEPTSDKVSQDQSQHFAKTVAVAQQTQVNTRTARLQQLTEAVRNGSYKPDAGQIAENILDDAEIDARMQAMLQR
jgi:anti-sigma28 factor (negative regulator of flagellin synthesis)